MGAEHGLFRSEAIEYASGRLYGDVLVRPRVSHVALTILLATLCASILYFAMAIEWNNSVPIAGVFEANAAARGESPLIGALYFPVSLRKKIEIGRSYYASVDGLRNQAWTPILIQRISDQVIAQCPICSNAEANAGPYVRVDAIALDPMIRLDGEWLALSAGVRFHFDLKLERQTVWRLLTARFGAGRAHP